MEAITTTVGRLAELDRIEIIDRLTKHGSEFQQEVASRRESDTPIAIVREGSWRIVSWAATHNWRSMQTLEGFTLPSHRRRSLARLAATMLVADGLIVPTLTVAVFAPHCIEIAHSAGCKDVLLFERRDGDWRINS